MDLSLVVYESPKNQNMYISYMEYKDSSSKKKKLKGCTRNTEEHPRKQYLYLANNETSFLFIVLLECQKLDYPSERIAASATISCSSKACSQNAMKMCLVPLNWDANQVGVISSNFKNVPSLVLETLNRKMQG